MAKKKEGGEGEGRSNGHGDGEPNFSDAEDFVDDVTDEELLGDLLRNRPKETDGIESVIVVDGLPVVGEDRLDKLKGVIRKIFGKFGAINSESYATSVPEGQSTSYMFVEYTDAAAAAEAVKTMDGYKFDKNHTLLVNFFTDFEKYENIVEDWKTPEPQPYKDSGNLWYYLMEKDAYDQYLVLKVGISKPGPGGHVIASNDVHVWLNSVPEPTEVLTRQGGTDTVAKWSPLGTYMATFHSKGVAVWGGEKFNKINRFAHVNAEFIDFSPNERYLVTFSPKAEKNFDPEVLIIWEIRTGAKKRTFSEVYKTPWPVIRWSHDDKYFARMGQDTLSVYETPSFRLQDNKSLKVTGIRDFSWSPTDNVIAYWVAENKDVPARVVLIEIPSRSEIRAKNLFNVADCRMHWQKSGDHLCVKVDRYTKLIKKDTREPKYIGMFYNFEVFHLREKNVPVDSVEIKEPIVAFSWEPIGSKFAIVHGEPNNVSTSFWGVRKGDAPILLKRFEKKRFNSLFWAPQGQFVVLAHLKSAEGPLEFIDTAEFTIMNSLTPEMTTDIEWDPTGRYVIAAVSAWTGKVSDTGFTLMNFQGRIIRKERVERFGNLFWRPRPPCLLTSQQIKNIKKNLKNYSPQFEREDKLKWLLRDKELIEKMRSKMDSWNEYRQKKEEQFSTQKKERVFLRSNTDTDELDADKSQLQEEVIEILIKEDVQPLDE